MNKHQMKTLFACVMAMAVFSGCAATHVSQEFGVANVHNIDKQTLNPAAYTNDVEHTISGEKAQKVIDGYHKEKPASRDQSLLKTVND